MNSDEMAYCVSTLCWSILLSFITSVGALSVSVTQTVHQGKTGGAVTLEWLLTSTNNISPESVAFHCTCVEPKPKKTFCVNDKYIKYPGHQHEHYRGRVKWEEAAIQNGSLRFILLNLTIHDSGTYHCAVAIGDEEDYQITFLRVTGSGSKPKISVVKKSDSGVDLQCESGGWYPEPEVEWLDSEGHVLSAGPTETVKDPDGTYTVRRNVTVEPITTNRFTCRVQHHIKQPRETAIHILVIQSSSSAPCIGLGVSVVVLVLLIITSVILYRRTQAEMGKQRNEAEEKQERLKWLTETKLNEGECRKDVEEEKRKDD